MWIPLVMVGLSSLGGVAQAAPVPEDSLLNTDKRRWRLEPSAEVGFLAPLSHEIQFGKDGSTLDYIEEGGQDNLFAVTRWVVDIRRSRSTVTFLYQPLNLQTQQVATRDLRIDGIDFVEGTPLELRYGFDFYRASYTYDLFPEEDRELGLGLSMQIRNATIGFTSGDGEQRTTNRDIGPVPVLKVRGRFELERRTWWGFEADGFYAPIKYLNGSNTDVVGAILDASVRAGVKASSGVEPFVNLRYLGGGAEGTSKNPDPGKDGYTSNWLHFATVSLGVMLR